MIYHRRGELAILRNAKRESAHPIPTPSIIGTTNPVAAAPIKHFVILFEAVTVPALPGYKSTIKTAMVFIVPLKQKAITNSRIKGPAKLVSKCNIQPKPILQALPKNTKGIATSSRALSIGKFVRSTLRFLSIESPSLFEWRRKFTWIILPRWNAATIQPRPNGM